MCFLTNFFLTYIVCLEGSIPQPHTACLYVCVPGLCWEWACLWVLPVLWGENAIPEVGVLGKQSLVLAEICVLIPRHASNISPVKMV